MTNSSYEKISNANASSSGRPDSNLANDSNHLGGIPAEDYATKDWVKRYHGEKETNLKKYIDEQDTKMLNAAKEYTNSAIRNQDFSNFAELTDLQALKIDLTSKINTDIANQKTYTDQKTQAIVNDVNANLKDVGNAIDQLNNNVDDLFQSVSDGKELVAEAITDKGVATSANASFNTMATNIRNINTSGGEIPPGYINTNDANAVASDIMAGKTAYARGQKLYGTNTGIYVPSTPTTGVDTSDATATASDISYGKTAYVGGTKITGTLQNLAVQEVFSLAENETYESKQIAGYINHAHNPDFPDEAEITCMGIGAMTDGEIYGLSSNQNRLIDGIQVKINNEITRYIRARCIDNTSIVHRVSGDNEPTEKTVFSFTELGLDPDTDISGIAVGIDGFQGKSSHRCLCISQGSKLHIYDYNAASNYIGKDPRDTIDYVGHWEVDFPYTEFTTSKPDSQGLISMPACANHNPDVCAVILANYTDNSNQRYMVLLKPNTYTENGAKKGRVYKQYSSAFQVSPSILRFSVNDNYILGSQGDTNLSNQPCALIAGIDTANYNFSSSSDIWINASESPVVIYENDTKCIFNGSLYNIAKVNGVPTLTPISSVKVAPQEHHAGFVSIDNKYYISTKQYKPNMIMPFATLIQIFKIDEAAQSAWPVIQTLVAPEPKDLYVNATMFNVEVTQGFSIGQNDLYRYSRGIDTTKLCAIKYKGSYWYPTLAEVLTASQSDVRTGKTFIGTMGYPETGTMEG